jgi:transposase
MIIIGCDYHPGFQQIAFVDIETGDCGEQRLQHREEAEKFYRDLAGQGKAVRVGMEASGHARWFERLLAELNFELWIGDAAEIRTKRVRKQKTDRQDAELILKLMLEDRFPQIWVPSWENRDLRQLLWHRHRMVSGAHTDHESAASGGAQRRSPVQEEVVAGSRTGTTGSVPVSPLGEPTPARPAGVAGPTGLDGGEADASD